MPPTPVEKTIAITGVTSGIGRATALALGARHQRLVMLTRSQERGQEVARHARQYGASEAEVLVCDLSLMASVRQAAAEIRERHDRIDVLINDASVFLSHRDVTAEGHERMMATNHLGPFLLTNLLLDLVIAGAPSRVIAVTAPSTVAPDPMDLESASGFRAVRVFGRSKAAELLFTYALARRLHDKAVSANAYHPGVTRTALMANAPLPMTMMGAVLRITARKPERAATGLVDLALSPSFDDMTGRLVHDGRPIEAPFADDIELQERLWRSTMEATGLSGGA
jgi:NAD(P)-dependent dehydrogenase (short-subunit alcohol dehydrogenase family)